MKYISLESQNNALFTGVKFTKIFIFLLEVETLNDFKIVIYKKAAFT